MTSIRKTNMPEPSIVALPKMLALFRSSLQVVAVRSIECTFLGCAGP
jgi:hypothetical protein